MKLQDKTWTAYVPVHSINGAEDAPNSIRIDIDHQKNRKQYYASLVPVTTTDGMESINLSDFVFTTLESNVTRFNAKALAAHAAVIARQLANPADRDVAIWKLIESTLQANELALMTPATGKDRGTIIAEILAASRNPCPELRETFTLLGSNGLYYRANGFPAGVTAVEPYVGKSDGFFCLAKDGTSYGVTGRDEATVRSDWEYAQDGKANDFAESLVAMSDTELEKQAIYWIK